MLKAASDSECGTFVRHACTRRPQLVLIQGPDVLNRFPQLDDQQQTTHIMRYIFPRQFSLHNVFTSKVDPRESAMAFKDYTLREKEIHQVLSRETRKKGTTEEEVAKRKTWVPKRLRGEVIVLVNRLRKLNSKCSYTELLRHYCPVEVTVTSPME